MGYCSEPDEFAFFVDQLSKLGLIERHGFGQWITVGGWGRVRELRRASETSLQAFVAMSFAPELDTVYSEGVHSAIEEAGYRPLRVDLEEHTDRIDDRILLSIKSSRFVVSDFTGQRQGVYFEAGYALGLGIPVIWTCAASEKDKLHFDTRQYNHILWESPGDLRERLYTRIKVRIG